MAKSNRAKKANSNAPSNTEAATTANASPAVAAASASVPATVDAAAAGERSTFKNRQRVLVFSSRGIIDRHRHLMNDFRDLLPHSKKDVKLDSKDELREIPSICEARSCNNCIFFDARKGGGSVNLFLWMGKMPYGPTVKFLCQNSYTLDELKLTGNCLKGSRPLLCFDKSFDNGGAHYQIMKEVFTQTFASPRNHPKTKPFVDHIFLISIVDNRIWFRNYQVVDTEEHKNREFEREKEVVGENRALSKFELIEIGPRFVLTPVQIFSGGFGGPVIWENPDYIHPRRMISEYRMKKLNRYEQRVSSKRRREEKEVELAVPEDEVATVFQQIQKKRNEQVL